jgi:hypothetical protein
MFAVHLTESQIRLLDQQVSGRGGYQSLLRRLRRSVHRSSGLLVLPQEDVERIRRYAFDYGNGGWEERLIALFGKSVLH